MTQDELVTNIKALRVEMMIAYRSIEDLQKVCVHNWSKWRHVETCPHFEDYEICKSKGTHEFSDFKECNDCGAFESTTCVDCRAK